MGDTGLEDAGVEELKENPLGAGEGAAPNAFEGAEEVGAAPNEKPPVVGVGAEGGAEGADADPNEKGVDEEEGGG